MSMPKWSQAPQESHGVLSLPHRVALARTLGVKMGSLTTMPTFRANEYAYETQIKVLSLPYTQLQMLSPSTASCHVNF